jgi:hypothetical protein
LAIHVPQTRLLSALGFGVAFLLVIAVTLLARGVGSVAGSGSGHTLEDIARDPGLRFGANQTPFPLAYAPEAIKPPSAAPGSIYAFIWPNDYYLVQGMWAGHPLGIDIGASPGDPVRAVRDGHVIFAGGDPCCSYGMFVIIEHDEGWASLYGHLSQIDVKYGDVVKQGQVFALSGSTGHVTGPHLHFELRHNGGVVDPLDYLEPHRDWAVTADLLAELQNQPTDSQLIGSGGPAGAEAGEPAPTDTPPTPAGPAPLNARSAILLGSQALSHQSMSSYDIDASSCTAAQTGPNWWVTCDGRLQGCRGQACMAQLTACVFDQPRIVTDACP